MASSTSDDSRLVDEIRLWRDGDEWVATDIGTGVTTQGASRQLALENLDDAVALHDGERGTNPTEAELRDIGIDPAANTTGDTTPPDVLE